jgi:glucose 1-dehydrogenase
MSTITRVALVTGAARGIGQAAAIELARHGCDIAVCDIAAEAEDTLAAIRECGRRAIFLRTDVSDRVAVEGMFDRITDEFGRIDILVNNAAMNIRKPLIDLEVADVEKVWGVALWGVFHCSQLAARQMVRQASGCILIISSVHAERAFPNSTAYNGAKAAVNHMALTWAAELAAHGIRVNVIEPGWIDTPGERATFSAKEIEERGSTLPLRRLGKPEEIAAAVRFLASDDASYVTGSCMRVDGGILLPT